MKDISHYKGTPVLTTIALKEEQAYLIMLLPKEGIKENLLKFKQKKLVWCAKTTNEESLFIFARSEKTVDYETILATDFEGNTYKINSLTGEATKKI